MIKILLILLGVVTVMLVTAYQSCGDIDFRIMVGMVTIWVGGLALLLTTVVGFFRTKEHGWHAWRPASWSLVSIAAIFFTLELSAQILHWEEQRAQAYTSFIEVHLERFRSSHGRYPSTLDELANEKSPPRLIRYSGNQSDYSFGIASTGMIWGGWVYDRKTKKWTYSD